ncbi:MAG: primosomal protein N' [Polyangiaceae bacterium]
MHLADVALPVPLGKTFHYEIPSADMGVRVGVRVVCPFGGRKLVGIVVNVLEGEPPPGVKSVVSVLDREPSIPEELMAFLRDVASYYFAPLGEVLRLALPPIEKENAKLVAKEGATARGVGERRARFVRAVDALPGTAKLTAKQAAVLARVRAEGTVALAKLEVEFPTARAMTQKLEAAGLVAFEDREVPADPFFRDAAEKDVPPELTSAQRDAVALVREALATSTKTTFLLHGVTGSGKTEVYLRSIADARARGVGTIVLVPEIALTPQLVSRFRARFGDEVAVIHSGLTPKERHTMFRRLLRGELDVVIGARSALFAPVKNLGLVVVDEEHDPSFKQEEGVRYNARDMAILRAHKVGGVSILGSATPSLESEHLASVGKATKIVLPERARAQELPKVEIIDLRRMGPGPSGDRRLSLPLHRAIEETLAAKGQTILFLNRRGFAPSVRCIGCGELANCPSCSVALTHHKKGGGSLRCHYCDFEAPMPEACPKCRQKTLVLEGLGTEKLEETLAASFPGARIARLDRDVASGKNVEAILRKVRAREVDILVGTQMVTKGHDLPFVTLVGVINADAALSIPDFRASERTFQLLVQVAGRAGRGDTKGRVIVQTYNPEHPAIVHSMRHDVAGFTKEALRERSESIEDVAYPPFSRAALVRIDATDEALVQSVARRLGEVARAAAAKSETAVVVSGPSPAPLARLRNRFRYRVMVRGTERKDLRRVLVAVLREGATLPRTVRVVVDVDPVQLL